MYIKYFRFLVAILFCAITSCSTVREKPRPATSTGKEAKREFRGAWIQTAFQGEYKDMTPARMKKDFIRKLNYLQACGINAIIFQVRPEADAFYKSDIEPWSRPAFSCAPCNASQQSELPAELEASFAHTAIHQRLYARLDSVASAIFTDQRTEKAGESEKQLPGFVVLGFSPDLTPAEYEKILSAAESRHDRTHRKSRLLGNDFPDFDPSIRAVGALYIQGNGPFAGLRIAVNGAGFVGSGPVAEIPAPLLDLSS